jgi:hypothetical protein
MSDVAGTTMDDESFAWCEPWCKLVLAAVVHPELQEAATSADCRPRGVTPCLDCSTALFSFAT